MTRDERQVRETMESVLRCVRELGELLGDKETARRLLGGRSPRHLLPGGHVLDELVTRRLVIPDSAGRVRIEASVVEEGELGERGQFFEMFDAEGRPRVSVSLDEGGCSMLAFVAKQDAAFEVLVSDNGPKVAVHGPGLGAAELGINVEEGDVVVKVRKGVAGEAVYRLDHEGNIREGARE